MIPEFIAPSFINENDADTIQERMMDELPADIDNTPGGFPWDFTRPTAIEKSELIQFHLVQTLMLMFPMWAWDKWLDYHAEIAGITRKKARYASGELRVNGIVGTAIPKGSVFATVAADTSSIEYTTEEEYIIGEDGMVTAAITAVLAGTNGNVAANTITLSIKPIKGVTSIYNENAVTGGTEEEDDESLRVRIQEANESITSSFVGNNSDYIRWAKEVSEVGSVVVVPEWNGAGTVKLVLLDDKGQPADESIIKNVENYICREDAPLLRKAPIGAIVKVDKPKSIALSYASSITLADGYDINKITASFENELIQYYKTAKQDGEIKYTKVSAILSHTEGVSDFTNLSINDNTRNILIDQDEYPMTESVAMTINGTEGD